MKTMLSILAILVLLQLAYPQTVVTDTIHSIDSLDGGICYMYEENNYYIVHGTPDSGPGDGYNPFLWVWIYCKGYYTFDIQSIPYDTLGFELISTTFQLFQYLSIGNDEHGVYPVWDFPGGDTNYCYLDHVNYGDILDLSDWTAGDEGDPQTLFPLYTVVSSTPDTGFRNMDITSLVESDIFELRERTQFRIHFPIGTDYDFYADRLAFRDSNFRRPKLIVEYRIGATGVEDENRKPPDDFLLIQNYPNPFNSSTTISYKINSPGVYELTIFDIKGRKSVILRYGFHTIGNYEVQWGGKSSSGGNIPSGVYFYRIRSKDQSLQKKLVLLR